MKAIDIWFIACMIFILAAIFEYACLLYLKKLFIRYLENKAIITIQVVICDFSIFVKTYTFRRKRLEKIEEKAKIRSHSSASISTLEVRFSMNIMNESNVYIFFVG